LTYDALSRVRTRSDDTGQTLTFDYNDLNKVTAVTYPDGKTDRRTYSNCCPGLITAITDRSGQTTSYDYDLAKRLIAVTNPEGGVTRYIDDPNGNTIRLTDANGNVTGFAYDLNNCRIQRTHADGRSLQYAYDSAGQLVDKINARGDVTALIDSSQTAVAGYKYDVFGKPVDRFGSLDQPFRHATKR
jgi:YD repeat-containing protein